MDFKTSVEPLDLSVNGSHSLGYHHRLCPPQVHVPGVSPASVWTRPQREPSWNVGRSAASPPEAGQYPTILNTTAVQGLYPYMCSVPYPALSPKGLAVSPKIAEWSYPASPEALPTSIDASGSPRRPSVSPQLTDVTEDDNLSNDPEFQNFRNDAVRAMTERNGGQLVGHNPRMRRPVQASQEVDDEYRRQRERNNLAAKQSRDRRKLREIEASLKVAFLQRKLEDLKALLAANKCSQCRTPCR